MFAPDMSNMSDIVKMFGMFAHAPEKIKIALDSSPDTMLTIIEFNNVIKTPTYPFYEKHFGRIVGCEGYCVHLDDSTITDVVGYEKRSDCIEKLESAFKKDKDYIVNEEGLAKQEYFLTAKCFKKLCMQAETKQQKEAFKYFNSLSDSIHRYMRYTHEFNKRRTPEFIDERLKSLKIDLKQVKVDKERAGVIYGNAHNHHIQRNDDETKKAYECAHKEFSQVHAKQYKIEQRIKEYTSDLSKVNVAQQPMRGEAVGRAWETMSKRP